MSDLVIMKEKQIYTTSLIISENLNIKHEYLVKLLKKHSDIENLSAPAMRKVSTKGRAIIEYLFTEDEALILVSLMANNPEVIKFKVKLVKAFIKYRKIAYQKFIHAQNADYQIKRLESKTIRRECTDTIKEFVEYAVKQGSKNAVMYYGNISKMELKGLFLIEQKFPGIRDFMTIKQLNLIEMADEAVRISLEEGMAQELPYKEIYLLAKSKIEAIAKIFPPSPLPALLQKQEVLL